MNIIDCRWISRPSLLPPKAVIKQSVAKLPLFSLSALVVALLKSCPRPPIAAVVPGWWPPSCPRLIATWWPPLPSWPLSTRRMRRVPSKPSPECHRRRPPAFFTTWKRPYETGNRSASFKQSQKQGFHHYHCLTTKQRVWTMWQTIFSFLPSYQLL